MKLSTKWIQQFTSIEVDNDELIKRIGAQLGAIEEVEDWSKYYDERIVVAEILTADAHPDADKLGLYTIRINQEGETRNLVAGDKSLVVGDKVAYLPPGVNVPSSVKNGDPFELTEREIRGHKSQGMLGSGKEILFSDDHEAVLKLESDMVVGQTLIEAYELDDLIIDVENKMFTHRPDLFGIVGLAREIAGIQGVKFDSPEWYRDVSGSILNNIESNDLPLNVEVEVGELCPRFTAVTLSNVSVSQSPAKMQSYLTRVGLRPINNLVDATNYVMYLTAQPLHAFDYDKVKQLSGGEAKLVVRKPKAGEKLTLLDDREIEPHKDSVLITTGDTALSLAGAMGGQNSEVDENTTNVILEVANWDLYSIRRTSFAHGVFTDAVTRYNKGQSSEQCLIANAECVKLMQSLAGAKISSPLIDIYPNEHKNPELKLGVEFVNHRLGSSFSAKDIQKTLELTEFEVIESNDSVLILKAPYWRTDVVLAEDLVEEIGRLVGFDNLPIDLPRRFSSPNRRSEELRQKGDIRNLMAKFGSQEVLTYNFVSSRMHNKAGYSQELIDNSYHIRNSISPELEYMRISMLPSLLDKVYSNVRQGYKNISLFEVNKTHNKQEVVDELPVERTVLAQVYSATSQDSAAYYNSKRTVDLLLKDMGQQPIYEPVTKIESPWAEAVSCLLEPKRSAQIVVSGVVVGYLGEFKSSVAGNFKLPEYSSGFEIDLGLIEPVKNDYQAISKYPSLNQDVTYELNDEVSFADLENLVHENLELEGVEIAISPVAIFRKDESSKRRITFNLRFSSHQRTLKTTEVNQAVEALREQLLKRQISQI